jgi:hypothetical protein
VPDIEQRLVARGLTPAAAAAAVTSVLENRVREQFEPLRHRERRQRLHRALAGAAGCACLLLGYWFGGGYSAGKTLLWLLLPLTCIWFPDAMAASAGPGRVALLRWCGWLVLLLIGGYWVVLLLISA